MPEGGRARRLGRALAALPLAVSEVTCTIGTAAVPSYPGGARPTSTVTLHGRRATGRGENVAWTADAHAGFRNRLAATPHGAWRLDAWTAVVRAAFPDPYERAALEAAAIDLALRQAATTPFGLIDVAPVPVAYAVSYGPLADPVAAVEPGVTLKLDVGPGWDDAVYAALAALGRVAVLDFKGGGRRDDHERAHAALPVAWLEDPASDGGPRPPALARRVSLDAT